MCSWRLNFVFTVFKIEFKLVILCSDGSKLVVSISSIILFSIFFKFRLDQVIIWWIVILQIRRRVTTDQPLNYPIEMDCFVVFFLSSSLWFSMEFEIESTFFGTILPEEVLRTLIFELFMSFAPMISHEWWLLVE